MTARPRATFHLPLPAFALAMLGMLTMLATAPALAQAFTILHTFSGPDGRYPSGLTISSSGTLYGTTWNGGNGNCPYEECGTVYELSYRNSGWTFKSLYSFTEDGSTGYYPDAPVTIGANGALYGTATDGGSAGNGVVFELQPPVTTCKTAFCYWTATVLHAFQGGAYDGARPVDASLIFDQAGNIYGTTGKGATNSGVVYELTPSGGGWSVSLLHSFVSNGVDGYDPTVGIIFDSAGNLYGTTEMGGTGGYGTIFQLTPSAGAWTESILHDFNLSNGAYPENLIMDHSGDLYGIATGYGDPIPANVFELTPADGSWIFYNLQIVPNCGDPESGVVMDAAGNFYGTCAGGGAHGFGWVFELTNSGGSWIVTDLHDFNLSDGYDPSGDLVLDASGNLYGTASAGGNGNNGVVWEITP